jgi:hypothetical protein
MRASLPIKQMKHNFVLIEQTDSSIQIIRIVSDIDTAMTEYTVSSSEYLKNCYPKSKSLFPVACMPELEHAIHDHAIPSLINMAYWIHTELSLNEGERDCLFTLFPHHSFEEKMHAAALEAVWIDSIETSRATGSVLLETPYLSIDGHSYYTPLHSASHGSIEPKSRSRLYHPNSSSPIAPSSDIIAGTFDSKSCQPILESMKKAVHRFEKDLAAVWDQQSDRIEKDDFADMIESLNTVMRPL